MNDPIILANHIEAAETTHMVKQLDAGKGPDALRVATAQWHSRIDDFMATSLTEHGITLACQSGCSWCCRSLRVDITAPEAFRIKDWLDQHRNKEELAELLRLAHENVERTTNLTPLQYSQARVTCLFLQNNRCSIYPVRPATCRTYHSLDADACERKFVMPAMRDGGLAVRGLLLGAQGFRNAMIAALRKHRLDAGTYELARSVYTILATPNVFALWRQGKKPFGQPPPNDPPIVSTD